MANDFSFTKPSVGAKLLLMMLCNTLFYTAFFAIFLLVTINLRSRFEFSGWEAGLIIGISTVIASLVGICTGAISDRVGRKLILQVGVLGAATAAVILGSASQGLMFAFGVLLISVAKSVCDGSFRALISDLVPENQRELAFSLRYQTLNIGAAIGSIIIAFATDDLRSFAAYFPAAGLFVSLAALVTFMLPSHNLTNGSKQFQAPSSFETVNVLARDVKMLMLTMVSFAYVMALTNEFHMMPQYLLVTGQDLKIFSWMAVANSITVGLVPVVITKLTSRLNPFFVMIVGLMVVAFGFLAFFFFEPYPWYIVGSALVGIGESLISSKLDFVADCFAPEGQKGLYFGAISLSHIGFAIGPIAGGILLDMQGKLFLMLPIWLCIIAIALAFYCKKLTEA